MKKSKIAILSALVVSITLVAGISTFVIYADKFDLPTDKEKYNDMVQHEKREKENIEANKTKKIDPPDEKALSEDLPNTDQFGILDATDMQLPFPSEFLKKHNIVTVGHASHNSVYTGNLAEKPDDGIIINFYTRIKTGETKTYFYTIPGSGKITLTELSPDNKIFKFKTSDGKTGTFDVSDKSGKYTIN